MPQLQIDLAEMLADAEHALNEKLAAAGFAMKAADDQSPGQWFLVPLRHRALGPVSIECNRDGSAAVFRQ